MKARPWSGIVKQYKWQCRNDEDDSGPDHDIPAGNLCFCREIQSTVRLVLEQLTTIQAVFSMAFFNFSPASEAYSEAWVISEKIWIYWAISLPLTIITMLSWLTWQRRFSRAWLAFIDALPTANKSARVGSYDCSILNLWFGWRQDASLVHVVTQICNLLGYALKILCFCHPNWDICDQFLILKLTTYILFDS